MSRVIKDDEEWQRAEDAKFKLAAELDDPLGGMTAAERERKLAIYDRTVELAEYYRRGRMVQEYPGLREQYKILGWTFQEFDNSAEGASPPETAPAAAKQPPAARKPEPKREPEKPRPSLSAWLDD